MSHPDSSHDRSNEYPEDNVTHYKSQKLAKPVKHKRTQLASKVGGWAKSLEKALKNKKR